MNGKIKVWGFTFVLALALITSACAPMTPAPGPAEETMPAEPKAPPEQKIKLRYFTWMGATDIEQFKPVLDEYMQLHPNIEVVHESVAGSGAAVYPDVLRTSMASGDPPDVFWMWGGEIAGPFIDAGQVLDLEPFYQKYNWDKLLAPWAVERVKRNGKLYGVPRVVYGMGFWYRKDVFEKHGLEVPKTYAEQEQVCQTLKENGIYCVTIGGKYGWHTMRVLDYFLETTCGPEIHDKLNRLEESWNTQCVIDAYSLFQNWINNGWVVPDFLVVEPGDARWPWYQGNAAMILEGIWYEGVLKNDEQDTKNFDFFLPPTDHEPLRYSAFPEQYMIAKDSKHIEEAAGFIDWLISPDTQKKYPAIFSNSATVGVNPDCNEWPLTCRWREILLTSTATYPPTDQAFVKELMDGFFEVQDAIVAGKYTPEEGAKLMQQRVEEWKDKTGK